MGMQRALEFAATLDLPFVFSSNGDGFVFLDRTSTGEHRESNLTLDIYPPPLRISVDMGLIDVNSSPETVT
jgi:type I restriction enzyme R subunit